MSARILPSSRDPFVDLPLTARPAQRDSAGVWQWVCLSDEGHLRMAVTRINPHGGQGRRGRLRYEIETTTGPNSRARLHYETSWQGVRDRLLALVQEHNGCVFEPEHWEYIEGIDGPVLVCNTHGLPAQGMVYDGGRGVCRGAAD